MSDDFKIRPEDHPDAVYELVTLRNRVLDGAYRLMTAAHIFSGKNPPPERSSAATSAPKNEQIKP